LQGAFAEAQAAYLSPRDTEVKALAEVLQQKKIGVVAHFYMDPQVGRHGDTIWTATASDQVGKRCHHLLRLDIVRHFCTICHTLMP
jgi:hypothetical protein